MNPRTKAIIAMAVAGLAAAPAADAHQRASLTGVQAHIRSADDALALAAEHAAGHEQAEAALALATSKLHVAQARREAGQVAPRNARRGARALRAVAGQYDQNAATFADLVPLTDGDAQLTAAHGIAASVRGRERATAELTRLAASLPEPARQAIAQAIAALAGDDQQQVEELAATLELPDLPTDVEAWLQFALDQATAGMTTAITQLETLMPQLPDPAQAGVQIALDHLNSAMNRVAGILQGIFGGGSPIPSGLPIPAGIFG